MSVSPAPGVARGQVQMRAVSGDEAGLRLDRWFQRHFPELSHGALQKLLRTGQVRIDGKRVEGKDRIEPGQTIRLPPGVTTHAAAEAARRSRRSPTRTPPESSAWSSIATTRPSS